MAKSNEQIALQVSKINIISNVVLFILKLFAGIFAHSTAMVSDAVHTLADILSTVVVIIGVKMANRQADKEHPYGHERLECVAALILSAIIFATGIGIGYSGIVRMIEGDYDGTLPGLLALLAAVVAIVIKESMYWYTRSVAKKINSGVLMADAWHHRSDSLSSVGSFFGILGARLGFPILDSVACVVISVLIIKAAFDIFNDSISKMVDKAAGTEIVESIKNAVSEQEGVLKIDSFKTRMFADKIYVDIEISADGAASLKQTHQIAQRVHDVIEERFPQVKHCMVHVNPDEI